MELQRHNDGGDELFQIMKERMSSEQERIFMISHYLYLQHGSDSTQFVVDFDNVWKTVEFTRRDNAKRILVKNFTEQIDYKIVAPQLGGAILEAHNEQKIHGGQNKETILLTVDCFKNFCMLAATTKAKEIRSYYVKMENIMHEYYKNFQSKNNELQTSLQVSQKETSVKRHEVLIETNKNKWVVYFCKIKSYDDGSFILKIGETIDIKNRIDALRCDFGMDIILLDVFVCENSIKFEKSLHNSNELLKYKYNKLEHKNKKFSMEAYHIPNQKEYEKIVKFANSEMLKYNNIELKRLRLEEKKIDLVSSLIPLCKNYDEVMNILNKINLPIGPRNIVAESETVATVPCVPDSVSVMQCDSSNVAMTTSPPLDSSAVVTEYVTDDEDKLLRLPSTEFSRSPAPCFASALSGHYVPAKWFAKGEQPARSNTLANTYENVFVENNDNDVTNIAAPQITANSTGPIVQIYHKNDLKNVIQVYNSIMEATRNFNYNNKTASFTAIKKAYQHKTIYLDYRWHFITDRQESDLHKSRNIGETVILHERNQGQVAMLNINKTKIIKVFKISKDAAKEILQHPSAMCCAIKHSTPLNNYYWMRWEHVDVSLRDNFLQSNLLPTKQPNVRGTKIKQLHPITNEIVKLFDSYTDIQKELKISVKKIKELIENNEIYMGKYKFKLL
jgi:phage anti-repressor protein